MYIYTFTYSKKKKRKERWQRKIDYSTSLSQSLTGKGESKRDSINIVRSGERVPPDGCCFHFYNFPPDAAAAAVDKKKMHSQWQLFTVLVI